MSFKTKIKRNKKLTIFLSHVYYINDTLQEKYLLQRKTHDNNIRIVAKRFYTDNPRPKRYI